MITVYHLFSYFTIMTDPLLEPCVCGVTPRIEGPLNKHYWWIGCSCALMLNVERIGRITAIDRWNTIMRGARQSYYTDAQLLKLYRTAHRISRGIPIGTLLFLTPKYEAEILEKLRASLDAEHEI